MANFTFSLANLVVFGSALYHFTMGIGCLMDLRLLQKMLKGFYGAKFTDKWQNSHEFLMKPLGGFALWTAFICAFASFHPGAWTETVQNSLAALFVFRGLLRIKYRQLFLEWMGVPWSRSRWNVLFNFGLALLLIVPGL